MDLLTPFQKGILEDCIEKGSGCLAVPMGAGKTLISLVLSKVLPGTGPILIVVSKTLIQNWVTEIDKFFKGKLPYVVFHKDFMHDRFDTYAGRKSGIVITTPDVTSKCYTDLKIPNVVATYGFLHDPPSKGKRGVGRFLYTTEWKCIVIDEVQRYTNVQTRRCNSLTNIYARHRWALSGTPLNEPTMNRIVGYLWLIGDYSVPIRETKMFIRSGQFKGLNETMVIRTKNDMEIPDSTCDVVGHKLYLRETQTYNLLHDVITHIIREHGYGGSDFPALALVTIIYLRQFLITPYYAFKALHAKVKKDIDIYRVYKDRFLAIDDQYSKVADSEYSSRIAAVMKKVNKHCDDKIVVFSCFRSGLDALNEYLPDDRKVFTIETGHSATERGNILKRFCRSTNGILLLTYSLGAEGLNLQCAHVAMMLDVWWNDGVIQQAIARVLRQGQKKTVNLYFFTSNTGIENGLFHKHEDKIRILRDLGIGNYGAKIDTMHITDILKLMRTRSNKLKLKQSCPI